MVKGPLPGLGLVNVGLRLPLHTIPFVFRWKSLAAGKVGFQGVARASWTSNGSQVDTIEELRAHILEAIELYLEGKDLGAYPEFIGLERVEVTT